MLFRFATLAAALVAAAPAFAQTAGSGAKGTTTIDAQTIEGVSDLEVSARGAAEIRRDDLSIFGEVLRYNRQFGVVEGEGGVRLQQGPDRFSGPRLQYNMLEDTGFFDQPLFLMQREQTSRGSAERLEFVGKDHYRLSKASFTTCRPGEEDWVLEARELDLDYGNDEGVARGMRLRFFDTTLLASPYASFPLEKRRRSGLLTPYYSQTSTRGLEVGIPYYWNIAPEHDATITPVIMGKRGLQVKNQFRYLGSDYVGDLRLEYLPNDRQYGEAREGMALQHAHSFSPSLKGNIDYNRVSDSRYFVDLGSQVRQITAGNLPQDANLAYNGSFDNGPYTLQARMQRFQTLQDPLSPTVPPYHRAPQFKFSTSQYGMGGFLDSTLPAEFVRFSHAYDVEAMRVGMTPTIAAPIISPGWYVTPRAGARAVGYSFDRLPTGQQGSESLAIPFVSLDSGMVLERTSSWFDSRLTQTLEPRMYYLYVPYHQQNTKRFDTELADFNYPQLFTENRFVGGDRFGDANQVTVAVSSRYLQQDGQEAFRATLGQRFYFDGERVGLDPTSTLRSTSDSNILASVGGRVFRSFTYDATTEYDHHADQAQRYTTALRYTPERAKVVNFTYRFNRGDALRQIDLSGQWPVTTGWYAVGRYNYSLLDKRLLEGLAGFEYNTGCWSFRTVLQRIQAATNVNSSALFFQLELRGVGQIGTDETVELLKRNVPGYSLTNPSDPMLTPPSARPRLPFEQVY